MTDALKDHEGTVSTEGRTITNLRFVDDIDGSAGEKEELVKLAEPLYKASTALGMEIRAEKTNLMTNNTSGIITEIKVNGQKPETVTSFKYLGSVVSELSVTSLRYSMPHCMYNLGFHGSEHSQTSPWSAMPRHDSQRTYWPV